MQFDRSGLGFLSVLDQEDRLPGAQRQRAVSYRDGERCIVACRVGSANLRSSLIAIRDKMAPTPPLIRD